MYSNEQIVKNLSDANELLDKGYTIKRIDRNAKDKSKCVFFFKYEEGIKEALASISKKHKK